MTNVTCRMSVWWTWDQPWPYSLSGTVELPVYVPFYSHFWFLAVVMVCLLLLGFILSTFTVTVINTFWGPQFVIILSALEVTFLFTTFKNWQFFVCIYKSDWCHSDIRIHIISRLCTSVLCCADRSLMEQVTTVQLIGSHLELCCMKWLLGDFRLMALTNKRCSSAFVWRNQSIQKLFCPMLLASYNWYDFDWIEQLNL